MKKLKKYTGIGLGIITAPAIIYGVYKTNVAPELINNKNNSLFLSKSKQGLSFPRSSARLSAKKSTNLDLDITLKSAANIEEKFQTMIGTSNITNGQSANIFEDSSGNLWSMGNGTPLQVLRKGKNTWEEAKNGSNITDGDGGTIFEDSSGNLWSMGDNTPLQVLKKGANTWEPAAHGSNITNGHGGTIFEDSSRNLWSMGRGTFWGMGKGTPLQVLRNGENTWKEAGHSSNITDGDGGTIFEDSSGNLWSMGIGTPLQVLKKGAPNWTSTVNSNITDGYAGAIFEDSSGNLWSMGYGTPLQVLRNGKNAWEEAENGSNITDGHGGTIFEDSSGNLWSMGIGTPLQVLRDGENTWNETGHSSNITNGKYGTIFEDSFGNLWSMGYGTPLQVLRKGKKDWELTGHSSNITDGVYGTIFEDSSGNLWSATKERPLQVKPFGFKKWINYWKPSILNRKEGGVSEIFEDQSGNIWSKGLNGESQVLEKYATKWKNADSSKAVKRKSVGHGVRTLPPISSPLIDINRLQQTELEDSSGNKWRMNAIMTDQEINRLLDLMQEEDERDFHFKWSVEYWGKQHDMVKDDNKGTLEVLRKGESNWKDAKHNSNIKDGRDGYIYEDSQGNLWSMGKGTPLQALKKGEDEWVPMANSNIVDGEGGIFFEDSRGNLWSKGKGTPLQVYANTKVQNKNNFKITNESNGTIFEDSQGNLWSMGYGTPLQVLREGATNWEEAAHGSNITNGTSGTIFEDSKGNLWSMGYWTPLQVLRKGATNWEEAGHNSNITNGEYGTIFEDSKGNLWSMADKSSLQVLKNGSSTWTSANNSNITDGQGGTIFEDSRGNLWSMGRRTPLQVLRSGEDNVLRSGEDNWEDAGNSSNITDGLFGSIFEDSRGNLWSMGNDTSLQVLRKGENTWESAGHESNIVDGEGGTIFEDSRGNLWSVGNGAVGILGGNNTPLQVLKKGAKTWVKAKGSNIWDGYGGTIHEDSQGNLWSMGNNGYLKVLRKGSFIWEKAIHSSTTNSSNIKSGMFASIYEDSQGNLWSMGNNTPLQVIEKATKGLDKILSKKFFNKYKLSFKNKRFNLEGDLSDIKRKYFKLKYKLSTDKAWKDFDAKGISKDVITTGEYQFEWVINNNLELVLPSRVMPSIPNQIVIDIGDITGTPTKKKGITSYIGANDGKITLPTTGLPTGVTIQVSKSGVKVTDLNNLAPGTYDMKYVFDTSKYILTSGTLPKLNSIVIVESTLTGINSKEITGVPTKDKIITSYIGANDGKITLPTTGLPTGITIQVTKGKTLVTDLDNLRPGTYDMEYVLDTSKYVLKSGTLPILTSVVITESDFRAVDKAAVIAVKPTISKDITSFKGSNDGSINVLTPLPDGVKVVITKDGKLFNGTDFHNLSPGEYVFKYELKDKYIWKNGSKPADVTLTIKDSTIIQVDGSTVNVKPNLKKSTTSYIDAKDGEINVPVLPDGFEFAVTKDGKTFTGYLTKLAPGVYNFTYQVKSGFVLKPNTNLPNEVSLTISGSTLIGIDHTLITGRPKVSKTITSYIDANDGKITLPTAGLPTGITIQVTKGKTLVTDLDNLKPGTYDMEYVLDTSKYVLKSGTLPILTSVVITESNITQIDGTIVTAIKPTISKDITSFKGNDDGSISVPVLPVGVKLVVLKDGKLFNGTDFHNLSPGEYVFKYELKDKYIWKNGSKPANVTLTIKDSTIIQVDGSTVNVKPNLTKGATSYIGAKDGEINVPVLPDGFEFAVTKDGKTFTGDLTKLAPGVYNFTYQVKSGFVLKPNTNLPNKVSLTISESTLIGIDPNNLKGTVSKKIEMHKGIAYGKIIIPKNYLPEGLKIQVTKDGKVVSVLDGKVVSVLNNLTPGIYKVEYIWDSDKYHLTSNNLPKLDSIFISASINDNHGISKNKGTSKLMLIIYILSAISGVSIFWTIWYKVKKRLKNKNGIL